jgi:predicted peptidase
MRIICMGALVVIAGFAFRTAPAQAQDDGPELLRPSYVSQVTGVERRYLLYVPKSYNRSQEHWPVIYFLHGGGERGDGREDLDYVLLHGPLMEAWIQKRDLPFIIVAPQLPLFGREGPGERGVQIPVRSVDDPPQRTPHIRARNPEGRVERPIERQSSGEYPGEFESYPDNDWPPEGWMHVEADLLHILDEVLNDYRADPDRVYLTGLSYGGFGTFDMAAAHPDRWAAIVPIVGTGNLDDVEALASEGIPTWLIGSGLDPVVKPHWLYEMAGALERAGHPSLRFTVHEDMSHDAWIRPYAGEDLYAWLLSHRRSDR